MRVAFIITCHWSDSIRPTGGELCTAIINSVIKSCKYDFCIYIIDNASQHQLPVPKDDKIQTIRVEDQSKLGLTGAWNLGLEKAFQDGCDILINSNDDLTFNDTINYFINYIINDENSTNTVYGPATNGTHFPSQRSDGPINEIRELPLRDWGTTLNGFVWGITRDHYKKWKHIQNEYFPYDHTHNAGDGKWGGQEGYWIGLSPQGLRAKLIMPTWIPHIKHRDWVRARDKFGFEPGQTKWKDL